MILTKFPARVGTPEQRVCETKDEAIERINIHNGATDVYATLYNGDNVVDKVCWDFDIEPAQDDKYDDWEGMMADFRKMTEYFEAEGYQQMSVFSGGGMHKYLKATEYRLERPRNALKAVQEKFQNELDLKTDDAIFGDIERIFRVPNTYHPGAGRYCVPLKPDEIYLSQEEITELAQEQRTDLEAIIPGSEYPIHKHDQATPSFGQSFSGDRIEGDFNPAEVEPEGTVFPIYPCISNLLKNQDKIETKGHGLGFRRRFLVILHLKETGHTYQETVQVLKKYLSNNEFYHCVYKEKQVQQVYKRSDLLFPECGRLEEEIPCIHDPPEDECESRDTIYYS